ncbi:elongation factor P [Patescibacteria group bacterium]|nr:elongation factor P [Patescibacteria group bacterium]MBU1876937.1 elongation factor P [Patescibacteria group bacterium]
MISYSELTKGVRIILDGQPHEIIEALNSFKGRGHSVLQAKLKNLKTGNVVSKTFHPSDSFEQADTSKIEVKFLYSHKDKYVFCEKDNPSKRFELTIEQVGEKSKFLSPNQIVELITLKDEIINFSLPIKINLKVVEAPPGEKGNRAESGNKIATLESGAKINVPLFIEIGDIIEVNTESGEYAKRVE